MIDGKDFFDQPIKNDKITYQNIRKIATGQGDDYTTGCLLDADPRAIKQINFTTNLDRAGNTRIYFILEEAQETVLTFHKAL